MCSVSELCLVVAVSVVVLCIAASEPMDQAYDDSQLEYRAANPNDMLPKPVRDDGLGSLLLKNLRFRDLERAYSGRSLSTILWNLQRLREEAEGGDEQGLERKAAVEKRKAVSVSQLAELLHHLKTRGVDNGVKLQSLRFGK